MRDETTGPVMDDRSEDRVDERATMCQHGHDADDCWLCYAAEMQDDEYLWGEEE